MLGDALRYPIWSTATREASGFATAAVLAAFVLLRIGAGLWPSWTAVLPGLLAVGPAVWFVGHLAAILRDTSAGETDVSEATMFRFTAARTRLGVRAFTVGVTYLLVPSVLVAAGGFLIASDAIPAGAAGLVASIIATVALLVVVAFTYLLPAAVAVGAQHGLRAALQRSAVRGLASGSYFVAWTGTVVLIVLGWGAISLTAAGSIGGILAVVWFTYAHLASARLLGLGIERTAGR